MGTQVDMQSSFRVPVNDHPSLLASVEILRSNGLVVTPERVPPFPEEEREQLRIGEELRKLLSVLERYLGLIFPRDPIIPREMGLRKLSGPGLRRSGTAGKKRHAKQE
jgi:hypothetical protein